MYPLEFRARAVGLVALAGMTPTQASAALGGVPPWTVSRWVADFRLRGGVRVGYGSHDVRPPVGAEGRWEADVADSGGPGGPGADLGELEARRDELERQVRELELRVAVMSRAAEILGKGPGADPSNELTNREKAELVRGLSGGEFTQAELLREVGLARSTYNDQLAAAARPDKLAWLRPLVRGSFERGGGTYGRRRVHADLAASGTRVSEKVVARVMREEGLVARGAGRRRRRWSSYAGDPPGAPPNLVRRDFRAGLPNHLWLTDISEFSIPAGKLYLSAALDCFDGAVAAWRTSRRPDAGLANSTLEAALAQREGWEPTVVHSDRGAHYRWPGWAAICEANGVARSMSARGCTPDNSAMEGFFGRMKVEMFYGRDWSGATLEDLAAEIDAYIGWHNEERIKVSLGGMSPMRYRRSLGLAA